MRTIKLLLCGDVMTGRVESTRSDQGRRFDTSFELKPHSRFLLGPIIT